MTHKSNKQYTQPTRDSRVDRAIDENLKRAFQETADEPLPQRFADLLDQLRQSKDSSEDSALE